MKSNVYITICTIFSFLMSFSIQSQAKIKKTYNQPIQDVFITELVYPQEKNEIQITIAPQFQKISKDQLLLTPILAEFGISNSWQLELEWNYQYNYLNSEEPINGMGDLQIGTKYSFMNVNNSNFHTAIGFELNLPTGNENKELGEGIVEYEPYFIMALDLPKLNNAQLFSQIGISFPQVRKDNIEQEAPEKKEINLNIGFFVPFNQTIFTSEVNWFTTKWNGGDENHLYYTPGMVWNLQNWELGFGFPIGLNKQADNYKAIAMLTYEFNISEEKD